MKKILLISLAVAFIIAMVSAAFASGYNSPLWSTQSAAPDPKIPHGGYADTTNKCKDCHAVHLASGNYKLLRAGSTDGQTACTYCHGLGGIVGSKNGVILNTAGHGLGGATGLINAPDDATPGFSIQAAQWGCGSCHSVHNNNTVTAISERVFTAANNTNAMLKGKPDSNSAGNALIGATVTLSRWCTECHGANYGTYGQSKTVGSGSAAFGHDAGSTGGINRNYKPDGTNTYAFVRQQVPGDMTAAPRCNQCHAAGAAVLPTSAGGWVAGQAGYVWRNQASGEGYFPHAGYSNSYSLLKASSNLSSAGNVRLDDVCNDCHYTPSLP